MPYKFTQLFNFQGQGFSETWYYNGTPAFPVSQGSVFDQVYQARADLCAENVLPVGWRLSDVSDPRKTFLRVPGKINGSGLNPDTVTNTWLASVRGANLTGRRSLWLRGIPDSWIVWDSSSQRFAPTGTLLTALAPYVNLLKVPPWAIRTVGGLKTSGNKTRVTAVSAGPGGGTLLACTPGMLTVTGNLIVSGFRKPLAQLNGTYEPSSSFVPGTNDILLVHKAASASEMAGYNGGAWVRNQVFGYSNISDVTLISPRERRVGRAFFVPRGRR